MPAKMKMPKMPANMDDDTAVEKYKRKLEQIELQQENENEKKTHSSQSSTTVVDKVVLAVEKFVTNLCNGDCVMDITEAHIIVLKSTLIESDSVRILLQSDVGDGTADYKIFNNLVGTEYMGASDFLSTMMVKHKDFIKAIPDIVAYGVSTNVIKAEDAPRLESLFAVWVKGWPWDIENIVDASLGRDVQGTNVKAVYSMIPPEALVPPDSAHLFKLVWSKKDGAVTDIAGVVRSAVIESEIEKAKQDSKGPKKGTAKKAKK